MVKKVFPVFFVLGLALVIFSLAYSQGAEVEPNNTCETAQDLGTVILPFTFDGSLEVLLEKGDVDFYRISGQPGLWVRVDLEGQATGQGTLQDPLLGADGSYCNQLAVNDDFNGLNARVEFKIPYDGVFSLAATSCCDYNFIGNSGVGGTYRLTVAQVPTIGSISGRAVDASTGDPLPGNSYPFFSAYLLRSDNYGNFTSVSYQQLDDLGRFQFSVDYDGAPLIVGTYQVVILDGFNHGVNLEPVDVSEGEHRDLGDIALTLPPPPASISGRIVDVNSGNPLPGPFSTVRLERCEEWGCLLVEFQVATSDGTFRFGGDPWNSLSPGSYQLRVTSSSYQESLVGPFNLAEGEQKDLGDIPLTPLPPSASISGRIVDANSGNPLPGDSPPYTFVELQRCEEWGCWYITSQAATSDGTFRFGGDQWSPLQPGSYRLRVMASSYYESIVGPFDLAEGEQKDLGDVPLSPFTFIGSIQGRVVDAINGEPVVAYVNLIRCDIFQDGGCASGSFIGSTVTDNIGVFSFERDYEGNLLRTGFYYVTVYADNYYDRVFELFEVAENELKDLGNLALTPYPVLFSDVQPCNSVPSKGGKCSYSVRVTNRQTTPLEGSAWSIVETFDLDSFVHYTSFQAGQESLRLNPEESAVVRFSIQVPDSVRDGAYICTEVFVGQGKFEGFFYPQGHEYLFCMYKGTDTFQVMSEEETARLMRQKRQPAVVPSPK